MFSGRRKAVASKGIAYEVARLLICLLLFCSRLPDTGAGDFPIWWLLAIHLRK